MKENSEDIFLKSAGICGTCDQYVHFISKTNWLRDNFQCSNCHSIPRERAMMAVIDDFLPDWRKVCIHEAASGGGRLSRKLKRECPAYIASKCDPSVAPGTVIDGLRFENLEALSFQDDSIDLHISQDVMEHVFDVDAAFAEIARTLKPGGMHIFTVPMTRRAESTVVRATLAQGEIKNHEPAAYHGDGSGGRSLVVHDWGFDIAQHIHAASGLFSQIIQIDDLNRGIRAQLIEVIVTIKPK